MKFAPLFVHCSLAAATLAAVASLAAKPPIPKEAEPAKKEPAPTVPAPPPADNSPALALSRWLIQAPSGGSAIALPFAQVFNAASGKRLLPFDPANATDKETLTRIGTALDAILPLMNRPESPARNVPASGDLRDVAARFDGELLGRLSGGKEKPVPLNHSYPAFSFPDPPSGRVYYLGTVLYQPGDDPTSPVLNFDPLACGLETDGVFLVIGIEHNGKPGRDITFLNWQVLDVSKLKVHFAPVFQTTGHAALQQGTVLTDGRKGRD